MGGGYINAKAVIWGGECVGFSTCGNWINVMT